MGLRLRSTTIQLKTKENNQTKEEKKKPQTQNQTHISTT
jgi:hypothetical protein